MLIEDYAMLGDLHTAALVGVDGSVDWMCAPRFDSPACFAALLGNHRNGRWRLGPEEMSRCSRRSYRPGSLILETTWETPTGTVRVTDAMPPRGDTTEVVRLIRVVEGLSGTVPMSLDLTVRFDYGSTLPWVRRREDLWEAVAGPDALWLHTPVRPHGADFATTAQFRVSAGDTVPFVLTYGRSYADRPADLDAARGLLDAQGFWDQWSAQTGVTGPWAAETQQSLVFLKALTHAPTGAVTAAATTSLPEQLGGPRNWDYRFCWLRDSTFTLRALLDSGYVTEAEAWRNWLLRAVAGDPAKLQIMYAVDGTRHLPERELGWLPGYAGSRPVRVGNAASGQLQLDVWGEVLDSMHLGRVHDIPPVERSWDLEKALLDHLEGHWRDPDNGIWEGRGKRRHFVYSKVMAWAGMDRGVRAIEEFGLDGPAQAWRRTRAAIHAEVCERGFDAERGTFTQFYGSRGLDGALLQIPRVGFLPHDDPRVIGTIRAIDRELAVDGLIRRYDPALDGGIDGLDGTEGTFVACSFWMVDALCGIGETAEATRRFESLLALRNDVGMLSEEYDPGEARQLGNTPQAFSHVGLINAARSLTRSGQPRHPSEHGATGSPHASCASGQSAPPPREPRAAR